MNNIVNDLYSSIERGREGKNIGIKTGIDKMDSFIGGIQKKTYYLITGLSGSGKSSYALYSYIYRPLKDNKNINMVLIYFSLEMSSKVLLAKLLGLYLYEEFGIIISYKILMSWEGVLSDKYYTYVLKGREWLNSIMDKFIIYDKSLNRDIFYREMMSVLETYGDFSTSEDGKRRLYKAHDPNKLVLCVIDPINLVFPMSGSTKKDEIDAISARAVSLRERCDCSFLILQQENRNSSNMDRRKSETTETSAEDLKDLPALFEIRVNFKYFYINFNKNTYK